jgi:hypothetical protein
MPVPALAENMTTDEELRHDLSLALHTITETNQSIRFADTKLGALAGVQALMVTVLAARHDPGGSAVVRLLHALCFLGVLVSALLLAASQAPRLFRQVEQPSRASFLDLVAMNTDQVLLVPTLERRHEDSWRQAALLARIAVAKFRWLTRASVSTVLTLTTVLIWLADVTSSSAG